MHVQLLSLEIFFISFSILLVVLGVLCSSKGISILSIPCLLFVFLAIIMTESKSQSKNAPVTTEASQLKQEEQPISEEERLRKEGDLYLQSMMRYGKDRYGFCWVFTVNQHNWAERIECSKIGR